MQGSITRAHLKQCSSSCREFPILSTVLRKVQTCRSREGSGESVGEPFSVTLHLPSPLNTPSFLESSLSAQTPPAFIAPAPRVGSVFTVNQRALPGRTFERLRCAQVPRCCAHARSCPALALSVILPCPG